MASERSALKGLVQQQLLFLCEKMGIKTDAATLMKVAEILISTHERLD